jgi:hypothetical protein
MPLQREAAAVDDQFGAVLDALFDPAFDPRLVLGGDDGTVVGAGVGISATIRSRSSSAVFLPTGTTTGRAMQRSPAEP